MAQRVTFPCFVLTSTLRLLVLPSRASAALSRLPSYGAFAILAGIAMRSQQLSTRSSSITRPAFL